MRKPCTWMVTTLRPRPWLLGFVAYQLVNPGYIGWWYRMWAHPQSWLGLNPAPVWLSASLVSFVVAAALLAAAFFQAICRAELETRLTARVIGRHALVQILGDLLRDVKAQLLFHGGFEAFARGKEIFQPVQHERLPVLACGTYARCTISATADERRSHCSASFSICWRPEAVMA